MLTSTHFLRLIVFCFILSFFFSLSLSASDHHRGPSPHQTLGVCRRALRRLSVAHLRRRVRQHWRVLHRLSRPGVQPGRIRVARYREIRLFMLLYRRAGLHARRARVAPVLSGTLRLFFNCRTLFLKGACAIFRKICNEISCLRFSTFHLSD